MTGAAFAVVEAQRQVRQAIKGLLHTAGASGCVNQTPPTTQSRGAHESQEVDCASLLDEKLCYWELSQCPLYSISVVHRHEITLPPS